MRTIIVATDFSPPSRRAFSYSVHLARLMKADLLCVYVLNTTDLRFAIHEELPDIMSNSTPQLRQAVEDYIAKRFKSLLRRYGRAHENISACYVRGVPSIEISRIAKEVSAELIVVGTRCRSVPADSPPGEYNPRTASASALSGFSSSRRHWNSHRSSNRCSPEL